ncbi:hypothetical protein VTK26DRAFT_4577 [Humicola hyalothermophila]
MASRGWGWDDFSVPFVLGQGGNGSGLGSQDKESRLPRQRLRQIGDKGLIPTVLMRKTTSFIHLNCPKVNPFFSAAISIGFPHIERFFNLPSTPQPNRQRHT